MLKQRAGRWMMQSKMKMMKGRKGDSKQGWISGRVGDDEVCPGWLGLDLSEVEALEIVPLFLITIV